MTDDIEIPDQNLDFVDTLDLDDMTQRRAATRVIVDFYGGVLSEIGARYLNFSPADLTQGVGPLWRKARGRFKSVRDVDIPSGYDSLLNRLHNEQNEVDHDFQYNPEKELLLEARRSGTEWADWIKTSAEKYEKTVGQQSAQETMVRLAQESLDAVQKSPDSLEYTDLRDEQSELNEQANLLSEKIDEIADETDRISNRLVFSLADSISLEQDSESIISEYHHRKEEAERLEKIREHENKTPYYVTEPYDKQDPGREIIMVSDVVGQEDQTISVNPHHPEIPEKTREKLKQMEVNTRYQILFEYDSNMNRYVKKIEKS